MTNLCNTVVVASETACGSDDNDDDANDDCDEETDDDGDDSRLDELLSLGPVGDKDGLTVTLKLLQPNKTTCKTISNNSY